MAIKHCVPLIYSDWRNWTTVFLPKCNSETLQGKVNNIFLPLSGGNNKNLNWKISPGFAWCWFMQPYSVVQYLPDKGDSMMRKMVFSWCFICCSVGVLDPWSLPRSRKHDCIIWGGEHIHACLGKKKEKQKQVAPKIEFVGVSWHTIF